MTRLDHVGRFLDNQHSIYSIAIVGLDLSLQWQLETNLISQN